jgi:uncharacterized membrane protein
MIFLDISLAAGVTGLGMLLGACAYESVVINPNYRADIPQSLEHMRDFMKVKTPANFFRVLSPVTMLLLLVSVIAAWRVDAVRWWLVGSLVILIAADTITYAFHYPRNRILFIDKLSPDKDMLKRLAREWQTGNEIRIVLLVMAFLTLLTGVFSNA